MREMEKWAMAIIDVVKYDGNPDVFAWRFPNQELATWTQLVVNQSQEAVLYKNGAALDLFGPGRHTLSTANIPFLNNIINLPFGGKSPFAAEVWFVNRVNALDVKWGTSTPIQLQDPKYNIIVPVRAFGQMGIKISDSRKFLVKLVGTLPFFDVSALVRYFRSLLMMNFNTILASYLVKQKISILEINAYIGEMAKHVETSIAEVMSDYGITVLNFYVNAVNVPEDDQSVQRLRTALARKAEMDIIGYTYQQERTFDTLEGAATNEGSASAGVMGAGLGLGMGVGVGGAFGDKMSILTRSMSASFTSPSSEDQTCPACRKVNAPGAGFCSGCGGRLGGAAPERQASAIPCSSCGKPLDPKHKFCAHCGDRYNACPKCGADNPEHVAVCVGCNAALPRPCPTCGEQVAGGAKFCPGCGGNVSQQCSSCGHEATPGQKFCLNCGHALAKGGDAQ